MHKLNKILSTVTLVVFLPAVIGFASILHYCTGCDCQEKETTFLFLSNDNQLAELCSQCNITDRLSCCSMGNDQQKCHSENDEHEHKSDIKVQKLEEPTTFPSLVKTLPEPTEIQYLQLNPEINLISYKSTSIISNYANGPPLYTSLSGVERLINNCVYRL